MRDRPCRGEPNVQGILFLVLGAFGTRFAHDAHQQADRHGIAGFGKRLEGVAAQHGSLVGSETVRLVKRIHQHRCSPRILESSQRLHGREAADRLLVGDRARGQEFHDFILVGGAAAHGSRLFHGTKRPGRTSPSLVSRRTTTGSSWTNSVLTLKSLLVTSSQKSRSPSGPARPGKDQQGTRPCATSRRPGCLACLAPFPSLAGVLAKLIQGSTPPFGLSRPSSLPIERERRHMGKWKEGL